MATVTRTTTFADGNTLTAAQLNNEFNNLLNAPAIMNSDIASGAAIATSKINATFPTGTIVGTTDTQTLSGKTFASTIQTITSYSPSGGGTATLTLSAGNLHFITMPAGNITIALSGPTTGQCFIVRITNDASVRTITWFSTIKWVNGAAPALTGSSKVDTFGFITTGSGTYDGYIVGQALS